MSDPSTSTLNPNAPWFIPEIPEHRNLVSQDQLSYYQTNLPAIRAQFYPVSDGVSHRIANNDLPSTTPKSMSGLAAQALVGVASQGVKSATDLISTGLSFAMENKRVALDKQVLELQREQYNRQWDSAAQVGLANPMQFGNLNQATFLFSRNSSVPSRSQLTVGNSPYGM